MNHLIAPSKLSELADMQNHVNGGIGSGQLDEMYE
jgi:hypothetical protein